MKKLNILFTILALAAFTVSCETYDDYDTDRETVVGFTTASKNINNVPEGGTKSTTVDLFISDVSSVDRTFSIELVDDLTDTAPENYTYDATVTFLADTREASITVTAVDVTITDERTFFGLAVKAENGAVSGGRTSVGLKN